MSNSIGKYYKINALYPALIALSLNIIYYLIYFHFIPLSSIKIINDDTLETMIVVVIMIMLTHLWGAGVIINDKVFEKIKPYKLVVFLLWFIPPLLIPFFLVRSLFIYQETRPIISIDAYTLINTLPYLIGLSIGYNKYLRAS